MDDRNDAARRYANEPYRDPLYEQPYKRGEIPAQPWASQRDHLDPIPDGQTVPDAAPPRSYWRWLGPAIIAGLVLFALAMCYGPATRGQY